MKLLITTVSTTSQLFANLNSEGTASDLTMI